MTITITLNADTPEDLTRMIRTLAETMGGGPAFAATIVAAEVSDDQKSATIKTKKKAAPDPLPPGELAPVQAPTAETTADIAEAIAAAPQANVVKQMTPAEMRSAGSDMLMVLFNREPASLTKIKDIQAKFGVKMFSDIPDDRAQEFYNDALLTANGTAEKAA
jgi:hypothetical protein